MTSVSPHGATTTAVMSGKRSNAYAATTLATVAAATATKGSGRGVPRVHHVPPLPPTTTITTANNSNNNSNSNDDDGDDATARATTMMAAAATTTTMGLSRREAALRTTGQTRLVVCDREKHSVRFHLCVQALSQGCIAAYMHLFDLAHRPPVCVDALAQTYFCVPDEALRWVQEQLCAIELLRRQSRFRDVCARCRDVADYFEREKDVAEAAWHYDAALEHALESLDRALEQEVRAAYAAFHERNGQHARAARRYATMYRVACALDDAATARDACAHLVRVYDALATRVGDMDAHAARTFREAAVRYARRSANPLVEARAYGRLGEAHEQSGNLHAALHYQRGCRDTAARAAAVADVAADDDSSDHADARHDACAATLHVAQLEGRLQMRSEAAASLRDALALAEELADDARVCRATMQMGETHRGDGDSAAAMACFERSFRAACASGQRALIDSARVAMGFAMGDHYMTHAAGGRGYLHVVCNDVRAQLAWHGTGTL